MIVEPPFTDNSMNVAVVGNCIPRQCGIATFTHDVATWLSAGLGPGSEVFVIAMNDRPEGYDYPPMVRFEVLQSNPRDYLRAADFVAISTNGAADKLIAARSVDLTELLTKLKRSS